MSGPAPDRSLRRAVLWSSAVIVSIAAVGYVLSWEIAHSWVGQPAPGAGNAFLFLFGEYERPFLLLLAGFTVTAGLWLLAPPVEGRGFRSADGWMALGRPLPIAVLVVLVTRLGAQFAMHDYPLSMDEFNFEFQSRILAEGQFAALVPPEWRDQIPAIKPLFVTYRPDDHTWVSGYLPVYAAIRAAFLSIGAEKWVNPLLSGAAVVLVASVAGRIWPDDRRRQLLAVLILATSSHFLLGGMGGYSMSAHLAFNLTWLLLWLRGGRCRLVAPWVGALALGLHNPFPHALFVAPFLLRLASQRKWRDLAYSFGVYALASVTWIAWWRYALPEGGIGLGESIFGFSGAMGVIVHLMNVSMVLSWQSPLVGLGIGVLAWRWKHLSATERDLMFGILLTLLFYALVLKPQGHGWGYRYAFPVLGGLVLLAVSGLALLESSSRERRASPTIAASLVLAVVAQVPLRLVNAREFTGLWARASDCLASLPTKSLTVPADSLWYGFDLIRNDPYLKPPVLLAGSRIRHDGQVVEGQRHLSAGDGVAVCVEELRTPGIQELRHQRPRD